MLSPIPLLLMDYAKSIDSHLRVNCSRKCEFKELFQMLSHMLQCLMAYAKMLLDEAVALLEEMEDNRVKPTVVIYAILMDSLCEAGKLEDAAKFFLDLVLKRLEPNVKIYTILMKGFCKKGLMDEANQLLRKMENDGCSPDDLTYNTIIRGYILKNDLTNALYYCDLMVSKGFKGNADTFSLLAGLLSSNNLSDSSKALLRKFLKLPE
ncbi:putative pentatricopeptide repeat-containing protein At1g12700, mitochondrial [Beta vulgaris subsp. vulgaris]|uniref:putative pentatricopeptide repeat-containing protein At1g12700, mitochondrial n=1 Tax=Beta vulgaris subsp. vulgaris TaxID=3555 RepID=UPI002546C05E|nr:putative pentatricopeptide repeat-containing protein At1g12700, mitochondrial [Beta vulgaris subsp. vulgaris]